MILSGWESVFFWIFSLAAILAGLLTVMARNAVHSALFLISSLVSVGGVMVLFLFVIMLVNVGAEEEGRNPIFNRTPQVTAALLFLALLGGALVVYVIPRGVQALQKRDEAKLKQAAAARETQDQALPPSATRVSRLANQTEVVGNSLYTYASLPFEIASLLLLVAIIGSVMLARTLKQEIAADDADPEVAKQAAGAETSAVGANE